MTLPFQASCVAIGDRALLIAGDSGSGKSSLALSLIDRGAQLVGDDGVLLEASDGKLFASPHPNTTGLLEVRNLGILRFATCTGIPVALVIRLDETAERFIEIADLILLQGIAVPLIRLWPHSQVLHLRAELALDRYGLFSS
jgi:serine kinase of HPr protein (carbohydrate metabolism regulator)